MSVDDILGAISFYNGTFVHNTAAYSGGAIQINSLSKLDSMMLNDVMITQNEAVLGAGISVAGQVVI